jgi:hypothetical protein
MGFHASTLLRQRGQPDRRSWCEDQRRMSSCCWMLAVMPSGHGTVRLPAPASPSNERVCRRRRYPRRRPSGCFRGVAYMPRSLRGRATQLRAQLNADGERAERDRAQLNRRRQPHRVPSCHGKVEAGGSGGARAVVLMPFAVPLPIPNTTVAVSNATVAALGEGSCVPGRCTDRRSPRRGPSAASLAR